VTRPQFAHTRWCYDDRGRLDCACGAQDDWDERQAALGSEYEAMQEYGDPAERERPGDEEPW
jgi:hypothetical protein